LYCPNCGTAVDEGSAFCSNCGALIKGNPEAAGALQGEKCAPSRNKKPRTGYLLSLIGGVLTFLSGIAYFVLGNPVAGALGVVFAILIIFFARRMFAAADVKKVGFFGFIPFVLGWFILIASGTLLPFDIVVSIAGLLTVVGSVSLFSGR
jgi:hypothetical protein